MMKSIQSLESYALSSTDIKRILKGVKIVEYAQLATFQTADELFDASGRCVLFFATENDQTGHWECLFKQNDGIHFFDSYGLDVDEAKDYVSQQLEIQLREYPDYLSALLSKAGVPVYHNPFKYQQFAADISTCGKHCVNRLLNQRLSGDQYLASMNAMKSQYNVSTYDEAVSVMMKQRYGIP